MFLSRSEIIAAVDNGDEGNPNSLVIRPFHSRQITALDAGHPMPSYGVSTDGYDVTYGTVAKRRKKTGKPFAPAHLNESDYETVHPELCPYTQRPCFIIPPKQGLCVSVAEWIQVPPWLLVLVTDKSTYARAFSLLPPTKINPGWDGHLVLEVFNGEDDPAIHYVGDGAATFVFGRLDDQASVGNVYRGAYQSQTLDGLHPRSLLVADRAQKLPSKMAETTNNGVQVDDD